MAKLRVINIDNGEVVSTTETRKKKWGSVVQEGVAIIKALDVNKGFMVFPQGSISNLTSELPNIYGYGSKMWLLSKGGRYQLELEK